MTAPVSCFNFFWQANEKRGRQIVIIAKIVYSLNIFYVPLPPTISCQGLLVSLFCSESMKGLNMF